MSQPYGYVGPPDEKPGGSLGRPWQPPAEIVPCEARAPKWIAVVAAAFIVQLVVVLLTQRDTSGGWMIALALVLAALALVVGIRALVARIRLDVDGITHVDLIGKRRIGLAEMDRPVVVEPRRRRQPGEHHRSRGYELIIRRLSGNGPWLLATAMFWRRDDLVRIAEALDAPRSAARTRAGVEKTYPGSTNWLLRRTHTQWGLATGVLVMLVTVLVT